MLIYNNYDKDEISELITDDNVTEQSIRTRYY